MGVSKFDPFFRIPNMGVANSVPHFSMGSKFDHISKFSEKTRIKLLLQETMKNIKYSHKNGGGWHPPFKMSIGLLDSRSGHRWNVDPICTTFFGCAKSWPPHLRRCGANLVPHFFDVVSKFDVQDFRKWGSKFATPFFWWGSKIWPHLFEKNKLCLQLHSKSVICCFKMDSLC